MRKENVGEKNTAMTTPAEQASSLSTTGEGTIEKNIIGYFPEWADNEKHNFYTVADIPWDKLTHVNYAFAKITEGKIDFLNKYLAIEKTYPDELPNLPFKGHFNQLIKYKNMYGNKVKTMISIGGYKDSHGFSVMALTEEGRQRFADSCLDFIRMYQFDGVDIDWEWPVEGGDVSMVYHPEDKKNFTFLMKTLRNTLDGASKKDNKTYYLSIAAPAIHWAIDNMEPGEYAQYLDFINIMSYDLNGSWQLNTAHHAPLFRSAKDPVAFENPKLNVDWAVSRFISLGVEPSKINVGIPYYCRGWKDVEGGDNGLWGQSSGGADGVWNDEGEIAAGINPFYHVKGVLENEASGYRKYRDSDCSSPWLWNPEKKVFYTYDDEVSLDRKLEYIIEKGLGGAMFWELSGDYPANGHTMTTRIFNKFKSTKALTSKQPK